MQRNTLIYVSLLSLVSSSALAKRPIVAVMAIADRTGKLTPKTLETLTDALRTRLATGAHFQVVDKSA